MCTLDTFSGVNGRFHRLMKCQMENVVFNQSVEGIKAEDDFKMCLTHWNSHTLLTCGCLEVARSVNLR